ncbi:MAG TPA: ribosome maturation factor RimM [Chitinophagaceae bacterium]|nr:ribosome maturation factor RimM [Chitinophagaceae bacterium]
MVEYFKIGKFITAHGLKGEILLKHSFGKKTSLKGLQAIFIEEKKDSFIPWFIQSVKIKNEEEVFIKLEGIDSREDAGKLTQKEIWLPEDDFKKFVAKTAPAGLLGYSIINEAEPIGAVLEVIEQPHQVLCRLELRGKELLIPINENTLQKIDHKKKQILVSLPEGLLDIYLT